MGLTHIMFSVTQSAVAQSVRLNVVSKRSVKVRSGDNFSAPMRDDSETFKNSLAGQSNWNAYEGAGEKELTPEEKKAKNAKEDAEAAARRAASAAKMRLSAKPPAPNQRKVSFPAFKILLFFDSLKSRTEEVYE